MCCGSSSFYISTIVLPGMTVLTNRAPSDAMPSGRNSESCLAFTQSPRADYTNQESNPAALSNRCNQCKVHLGGTGGSGPKHGEQTGHQWQPAYACTNCGVAFRKKKKCKTHITTKACVVAAQPSTAALGLSGGLYGGKPSVLSHPVTVIHIPVVPVPAATNNTTGLSLLDLGPSSRSGSKEWQTVPSNKDEVRHIYDEYTVIRLMRFP